jgi:hypothetical protein
MEQTHWEDIAVTSAAQQTPSNFMGPQVSSPYSQQPATGTPPWPDQANKHSKLYFPNIRFNITLPSTPRSSVHAFQPKFCMHFSTPLSLHAPPISSCDLIVLIISGEQCRLWSVLLVCSLPSLHPYWVQMFSQASSIRLLLTWQIRFHTHTKRHVNLSVCVF